MIRALINYWTIILNHVVATKIVFCRDRFKSWSYSSRFIKNRDGNPKPI